MKKILLLGLVAFMALFSTNANAQVTFGVKGEIGRASCRERV